MVKIRSQLSTIFSNTGSASEMELLITFSTSAEARCCSSASSRSRVRRAISISWEVAEERCFDVAFGKKVAGLRRLALLAFPTAFERRFMALPSPHYEGW